MASRKRRVLPDPIIVEVQLPPLSPMNEEIINVEDDDLMPVVTGKQMEAPIEISDEEEDDNSPEVVEVHPPGGSWWDQPSPEAVAIKDEITEAQESVVTDKETVHQQANQAPVTPISVAPAAANAPPTSTIHHCHLCSTIYGSATSLAKHIKFDHQKGATTSPRPWKHICDYCGKAWKTPNLLDIHRRMHTGEKPYPCPVCPHKVSNAGALRSHMKHRHAGVEWSMPTPFACTLCEDAFFEKNKLVRHMKKRHPGEEEVTQSNPNWLKDEEESRETALNPNGDFDPNQVSTSESLYTSVIFSKACHHCYSIFPSYTALSAHLALDHDDRVDTSLMLDETSPHQCTVCRKAFPNSGQLIEHRRRHTGERPWTCELCHLLFVEKSGLRHHRRRQHGLLATTICKAANWLGSDSDYPEASTRVTTSTVGQLPFLQNSTVEWAWRCELCPALFARKYDLEVHRERSHNCVDPLTDLANKVPPKPQWSRVAKVARPKDPTEAPQGDPNDHTCHLCFSKYTSAKSLRGHLAMDHTDSAESAPPRPGTWICEFCGKNWTNRGFLEKHRRIHTGETPFTCDFCPYKAKHASALRFHVKKYHPDETGWTLPCPFACTACEAKFSEPHQLEKHVERKHTKEAEDAGKGRGNKAKKRKVKSAKGGRGGKRLKKSNFDVQLDGNEVNGDEDQQQQRQQSENRQHSMSMRQSRRKKVWQDWIVD